MTEHDFNIKDSLTDVSKNQGWAAVRASKLGGVTWELKIREGTTRNAETLTIRSGEPGQGSIENKRPSSMMNKRRRLR